MRVRKVGGLGRSSPRKIFSVSEIASGVMCEAKMHYAEVVALSQLFVAC